MWHSFAAVNKGNPDRAVYQLTGWLNSAEQTQRFSIGVVLFWAANLAMLMMIAIPAVYQGQGFQE